MSRTLFIHWGLPRTGTTALQTCLGAHLRALAAQGILYPRMGWQGSPHPAHHNIAWQLIGDSRFASTRGTIDDLLLELRQHDGNALLSSEDFVMTAYHPEALARFVGQLRQLDYRVVVVLALRHQREFAHSLYAEMVAHHRFRMGFSDYVQAISSGAEFCYHRWRFPFDFQAYLRLLEPFFPEIRIVPFKAVGPHSQVDFTASLLDACGVDVSRLSVPPVINRSACAWSLLRSHHRSCHGVVTRSADVVFDQFRQFCPHIARFTPAEAELLDRTFAVGNAAIEQVWQFQFNTSQSASLPARTLCFSDVFRADFHQMVVAIADQNLASRWQRWVHARINRAGRVP